MCIRDRGSHGRGWHGSGLGGLDRHAARAARAGEAVVTVTAQLEAMFDARARELSRSASASTNERLVTLLTFAHGEMRFAVEPHSVARVLRDPKPTRIPRAPRHLCQV